MTANRDFKRLVRTRMRKTGESYMAARRHFLARPASASAVAPPPAPAPATLRVTDYAARAGMSDAKIKEKTGCDWKNWVHALDHVKADTWPHRAIAQYVQEKYKVPDWWTQWVTTGYERIKGLRERGQRMDGSYEVTKSKVFAVGVSRLFRAFTERRTRARWLGDVHFAVRTKSLNKTLRITWEDGSSLQLYFVRKSPTKSSLAVQHGKLPDKAAAARMKEFWTERLAALEGVLKS